MRTLQRFGVLILVYCAGAAAAPPEEWLVSTPSSEGVRADVLAQLDAHIRGALPHVRSVLIARHGRLLFEQYYGDASRDGLHNVQSMTKSISSALVGIAVKQRLIASLEGRVLDYLPEYGNAIADPRMKDITLRHLLTMASGIDEVPLSFDKAVENPLAVIFGQRLLYAPGQGFRYSSAAAHLLGGVLRKACGGAVLDYAERELFRPLGMGRVEWYADRTGLQSGGMSALMRSRDVLKLGELYLRRGTWGGKVLIPAGYIAESVKVHNEGDFYGERARYGYLWWITSVGGLEAFYARGYGGQYLMVIPKLDVVVLCTSDWKQPEYSEHFALVEKFVVPAIGLAGR